MTDTATPTGHTPTGETPISVYDHESFRARLWNSRRNLVDHPELGEHRAQKWYDTIGDRKRLHRIDLDSIMQPPAVWSAILNNIEDRSSPNLIFAGPLGVGKTACLAAMTAEAVYQGREAVYADAPSMMTALGPRRSGIDALKTADFLAIDDVGREDSDDRTRSTWFQIADGRYTANRQLAISTNFISDEDIAAWLGEATWSRIAENCQIIFLSGPDRRRQTWPNRHACGLEERIDVINRITQYPGDERRALFVAADLDGLHRPTRARFNCEGWSCFLDTYRNEATKDSGTSSNARSPK